MPQQNTIIDQIYEAAVLAEFWPTVIELLAETVGCFGGAFFSVNKGGTHYAASRNCIDHLQALMTDEWAALNVRAHNLIALKQPAFMTDHDLCTDEQIENLDIYRKFLRPRGLGWVVGTYIQGAQGDIGILSLDQRYESGPFSSKVVQFLDGLRPHIARAAMLSSQFQMEKRRSSLSGLEALGIPAAVIDSRGKVKLANRHFADHARLISISAHDTISVRDPAANSLLKMALSLLTTENDPGPRSIPVPGSEESPAVVLNIVPLRRQARDLFGNGEAILAIVPLSFPGLPFKTLIQSLYDLTPTEARTTEALVEGRSIRDIARLNGVSPETVRSHVKHVLSKTGTSRQAELVSRFSSFSPASG